MVVTSVPLPMDDVVATGVMKKMVVRSVLRAKRHDDILRVRIWTLKGKRANAVGGAMESWPVKAIVVVVFFIAALCSDAKIGHFPAKFFRHFGQMIFIVVRPIYIGGPCSGTRGAVVMVLNRNYMARFSLQDQCTIPFSSS